MAQTSVDTLYELIQESVSQRTVLNTVDYANQNVNDYLGQTDCRTAIPAQRTYLTQINRQQKACISNWTVLGLDPPRFAFKPRETSDPPLYYLNANAQVQTNPALAEVLKNIQPGPNGELDADSAQSVKSVIQQSQQLAQQGQMQNAMQGAVPRVVMPPLPDNLLVEVNDQTCTDAYQEIFDILWDKCNLDFYVRENILFTIVQGTQFMAYEWNDDEQRPNVWNPEWLFVHVDPSRTDISRSAWAIMGFLMSADEAKGRFPDIDPNVIEENSTRTPVVTGASGMIYPAFYRNGSFKRNMCIVWTMWQRYQPFPMDAREAMDKGIVVPGQPDQPGVLARIGNGIRKAFGMGGSDDAADTQEQDGAQDSGAAGAPPPAAGPTGTPPPTVLRHAKHGTVVGSIAPDGTPIGHTQHNHWPVRRGILQTQIIGNGKSGVQVSQHECEFADIPLPHNVNIPIIQTPLGQGEPTRLRPIQRAIDNLATNLMAQATTNAFSVQLIARSVYESLGQKDLEMAHVEGGKVLIIDDEIAKKIGGLDNGFKTIPAAEVSEGLVKLFSQLLAIADKESDMLDSPDMAGSPWSGQAIEQAAAPNKNAVSMKGMRVEQMLTYLAKLIDGDITSPVRLSAQQLNQMCPKYPVQVWEALQTRRKRLIVDITCEITNGSGAAKTRKIQDALSQYNNGTGPMGQFLVQTLEDLGKDPDAMVAKQNAFDQMRAASQQQSQPASAAVAPGGNQPGPPQGGQPQQAPQPQVTAAPQGPPQTAAA